MKVSRLVGRAVAAAALATADPGLADTFDPARLASIRPPPLASAPMDGVFTDQHGRHVTLAGIAAGRPIVLAPVQHGCLTLCGLTLETLGTAVGRQPIGPGRDFAVVAMGLDPREGPADAVQSAQRLGRPAAEALVGDARPVMRALGYSYSWIEPGRQLAHLSAVAVLAPDGRLVRWVQGSPLNPKALGEAIARARTAQPPPTLSDNIRLLCYHLDPSRGGASARVWLWLRWSVGLTAFAMVAIAIAGLARRRFKP